MAASFSVFNWLSSPSINKVDTYIHRKELKLLKQGDKFFPYLSLGLLSSSISRLWSPFPFIRVFFCKFALRVERIKRKERKTSYNAVDHCMLRHNDTRHFELSSVLHLIKKKYWPMYSSSDIRSAKNSTTLGTEANLIVVKLQCFDVKLQSCYQQVFNQLAEYSQTYFHGNCDLSVW